MNVFNVYDLYTSSGSAKHRTYTYSYNTPLAWESSSTTQQNTPQALPFLTHVTIWCLGCSGRLEIGATTTAQPGRARPCTVLIRKGNYYRSLLGHIWMHTLGDSDGYTKLCMWPASSCWSFLFPSLPLYSNTTITLNDRLGLHTQIYRLFMRCGRGKGGFCYGRGAQNAMTLVAVSSLQRLAPHLEQQRVRFRLIVVLVVAARAVHLPTLLTGEQGASCSQAKSPCHLAWFRPAVEVLWKFSAWSNGIIPMNKNDWNPRSCHTTN